MQTKPYTPPEAWKDATALERARHLYSVFEGWAATEHCKEEGIPEDVQRLGSLLARQDKEDRYLRKSLFGDPAYGSWPSYAKETKAACVLCHQRREPSKLFPHDPLCSCELSQYTGGQE